MVRSLKSDAEPKTGQRLRRSVCVVIVLRRRGTITESLRPLCSYTSYVRLYVNYVRYVLIKAMCSSLSLKHEQSAYHDGVGEVPVGLALQAHGAELRSHVALGRGLVEGGLLDASHLGDHKEGKHTLQGGGGTTCWKDRR